MSDFGLDAYALDEEDSGGHPHPLEIARDLIATGKPRLALEVLSLHHDRLADDPEYLLLCAEAWLADGDSLRAQQALLGAVRLDAKDPRPLRWLGELLSERGEHERAERLLAKARGLEALANDAEEPPDPMGPDAEHDLIAFAEQQERRHQAALTPRRTLLGVVALAAVALLIAAISRVASPDAEVLSEDEASLAVAPSAQDEAPPFESEPVLADSESVLADLEPVLVDSTLHDPQEPELRTEPVPIVVEAELALAPPPAPAPAAPPTKIPRARVAPPARKAEAPPKDEPEPEPRDADVQAELSSMDPKRLTARGEELQARGHTALAASYYRRALEIDPDYAPALVGMGDGFLRAKKYADAMSSATRALQLARGVDARPGLEAAAIYQMGRVHYERGERDAARNLFRQSISLKGTPAEAWFYLGEALSSDNSPAAREAYEKYLQLVTKGNLADRARRAIQ